MIGLRKSGDGSSHAARSRPHESMAGFLCSAALLFVLLPACRTTAPRAASQPAPPPHENALLIEYIGEQPFVTADSGYRAVYSFWKNGESFEGEFEALAALLVENKIASGAWHQTPDEVLDRATVAYMICRAANIHGVNWDLMGLGRYAWRELVHRGIAYPGSELRLVSGGELLGILYRAEDHLQDIGRGGKRVELGEEPTHP